MFVFLRNTHEKKKPFSWGDVTRHQVECLPSPYLVCPSAEELIERLWTGEEAKTRVVEPNCLSITICPLKRVWAGSRLPVGADDDS